NDEPPPAREAWLRNCTTASAVELSVFGRPVTLARPNACPFVRDESRRPPSRRRRHRRDLRRRCRHLPHVERRDDGRTRERLVPGPIRRTERVDAAAPDLVERRPERGRPADPRCRTGPAPFG